MPERTLAAPRLARLVLPPFAAPRIPRARRSAASAARDHVMSNKYPGFCVACRRKVPAQHGQLTRSASGAYVVDCALPAGAPVAAPVAPVTTPAPVAPVATVATITQESYDRLVREREEAQDALDAARAKISAAGFASLDALIAAVQTPRHGAAALDAATARRVLEAAARASVEAGLRALGEIAHQETAEEFAAREAARLAILSAPRVIEIDGDPAPSQGAPVAPVAAPEAPVASPAPQLTTTPEAPSSPALPSGVRARLAARRAKGGR